MPSRARVWSQLSGPKPPTTPLGRPVPSGTEASGRCTWVRAAFGPAPPSQPKPRNSPPDLPAGCARRGVRGQLRARSGSARGDLPSPRRWVWRSRSCYPETEGRKTAPAARPSRRGAATAGNKGDKAASAGPGSAPSTPPSRRAALPPRAARVRPEAAWRAGCAAPAPRDPSFRSRGIGVCEGPGWGGDQPLSLSGGCCNPAVAMATQTCRVRSLARSVGGPPRPAGASPARGSGPAARPTHRTLEAAAMVAWLTPGCSDTALALPEFDGTRVPHLPGLFPNHHLHYPLRASPCAPSALFPF